MSMICLGWLFNSQELFLIWPKKKIFLKIEFAGGHEVEFRNLDQVRKWAEIEQAAWISFYNSCQSADIDNNIASKNAVLQSIRVGQIDIIDALRSEIDSMPQDIDVSTLRANFKRFKNQQYICAESIRGQQVLTLSQTDIYGAISLLAVWNTVNFPIVEALAIFQNPNSRQPRLKWGISYIKGIILSTLFDEGVKNDSKSEKELLKKLRSNLQSIHSEYADKLEKSNSDYTDLVKSFLDLKTESISRIDAFIEESASNLQRNKELCGQEIEAIKKLYREELALRGPVEYWRTKANKHKEILRTWSVAFLLLIIACFFGFPFAIEHMTKALQQTSLGVSSDSDLSALTLFFVLTFPAFLAIWLMRLVSRTLLSHQAQMNDAEHRAIMTNTFLALMAEGKANDNDRILILNALFQPMSSHGDDGSPPHWFEVLQERIRLRTH